MRMGRPPTPSHHTGIAPVVRAVWVAGSGCTVHTPCGGSLIPSPSVHIRCGCCVCFDAERSVCSILAGRAIAHTRGMGGVQVISLHPYKHTTATLLVHSHWAMSLMKQRSVWSGSHPPDLNRVGGGRLVTIVARGNDVSAGLVTRLRRLAEKRDKPCSGLCPQG